MTLIRDTAGSLYLVRENPSTPQAYIGYPVKRVPSGPSMGKYMLKTRNAEARLIRKAGTVVVEG